MNADPRHVAVLARGVPFRIEGQWGAVREGRLLPFIQGVKGAKPFVPIEHPGQICFVAGSAKLGCAIKRFHHGLNVPFGVLHDHPIWHFSRNGISLCVYDHCRDSHDIGGQSVRWLKFLDGVANRAGDTVLVEAPIRIPGMRGQRPGQKCDGIVAAFAMPGVGDAIGCYEQIDILLVERLAERIGMQRLTPLMVGSLVAVAASIPHAETRPPI